jgi:PAS domain S-box-containing protein
MNERELSGCEGNDVRWWAGFRRAYLPDYNPAAAGFWLGLALIGASALMLSGVRLAQLEASELLQVLGWSGIAAIAAAFPIQLPRSKHSIATGDVVIFLLLGLHGTSAAVLAASLEALIAASRSSARLSSRIASPCAAAVGMTIGGSLLDAAQPWLQAHGFPQAAAHLAALAIAVAAYFIVSTMTLMQIICLKRGVRLTPKDWFDNTSWVGALYLVSAVLAGLLSVNAQQFGRSAAAVGVGVIAVSLVLLRVHIRQRIAEDEAKEARVAAAELEAEQHQKRFHSAFTHASIGMAIVSSKGTVLQANQALCALLGYDETRLLQRAFRDLLQPGDAALLDRHVAGVAERREDTFSIELRCLGADQRETWISLHCARFDDHASSDPGLIFQLHDISSRRRAEGELRHIAYHDTLTDLANRNCFQERLSVAVERSRLDRRFNFAVLYLDLDRFKLVNDTLGHPAGDELLKEAARRLIACVRPKDLVARLGGDEFAILLEEPLHHADIVGLGERLLLALEEPV